MYVLIQKDTLVCKEVCYRAVTYQPPQNNYLTSLLGGLSIESVDQLFKVEGTMIWFILLRIRTI